VGESFEELDSVNFSFERNGNTDRENMNRLLTATNRVATSMVRRQIAVTHNLNGKVMDLEDYDAFKGTLDGSPNLVIDFHAEWCGPCKMLGPLIKKEIATHEDVDLLKVDVDEFDEIAMHYEIRAMPTVIFVKNGEEIDRFVGFRQGADLTDFINKNK